MIDNDSTPGSQLSGSGIAPDPVLLWANAVVANGGTVSAGRVTVVQTLVNAMRTAGTLQKSDDFWILGAENAGQALTSFKLRRLAVAVATPTFTIDRGYTFNGTSNYIDSTFAPSLWGRRLTGSNQRIAVYMRNSLANNGWAAGCTEAALRGLQIRTQSAANLRGMQLNCTATNLASPTVTSVGYSAVSRTAAGVFECYQTGASLGIISPSTGTVLPSSTLYFGCQNSSGVAASFLAANLAFVIVGASLTAAEEAAEYAAVQAFMTSIGAQV